MPLTEYSGMKRVAGVIFFAVSLKEDFFKTAKSCHLPRKRMKNSRKNILTWKTGRYRKSCPESAGKRPANPSEPSCLPLKTELSSLPRQSRLFPLSNCSNASSAGSDGLYRFEFFLPLEDSVPSVIFKCFDKVG